MTLRDRIAELLDPLDDVETWWLLSDGRLIVRIAGQFPHSAGELRVYSPAVVAEWLATFERQPELLDRPG